MGQSKREMQYLVYSNNTNHIKAANELSICKEQHERVWRRQQSVGLRAWKSPGWNVKTASGDGD